MDNQTTSPGQEDSENMTSDHSETIGQLRVNENYTTNSTNNINISEISNFTVVVEAINQAAESNGSAIVELNTTQAEEIESILENNNIDGDRFYISTQSTTYQCTLVRQL